MLQILCVCTQSLQSCLTLCDHMDCSLPGSSVQGILQSGKNTGVGCHALLQGIFLTQGSNLHLLCLLHWQVGSLSLAPNEEPIVVTTAINFESNSISLSGYCCYIRKLVATLLNFIFINIKIWCFNEFQVILQLQSNLKLCKATFISTHR